MNLADVARWHRDRQVECVACKRHALWAAQVGNEDAAFHAAGWRGMARDHERMAEAIERAIEERQS